MGGSKALTGGGGVNDMGILKIGEKPVHYLCEGFLGLGSRLTALREPPTAAAERPAAD